MFTNCEADYYDVLLLRTTVSKESLFSKDLIHSYSYYFSIQPQTDFIREQLGGPRTVTKWEYSAMTSESLVSKNLVFMEIPSRLMIEKKTCGACWVNHSPTGCFIFCV